MFMTQMDVLNFFYVQYRVNSCVFFFSKQSKSCIYFLACPSGLCFLPFSRNDFASFRLACAPRALRRQVILPHLPGARFLQLGAERLVLCAGHFQVLHSCHM